MDLTAEAESRPLAPQTFGELNAIAESAQQGSHRRLGRRALVALVFMLERPHRAAVQNISEIAREAGVDPSTLTRLGQRLGFNGFTELQEVFRKYVAERGLFYSSQAQSLMEHQRIDAPSGVQDLANEEVGRLLETAAGLKESNVERAAELICRADTVYVLGLRATYSVAFFFGSFLGFLRPKVMILGAGGAAIGEELAQISERDVLVAVSFRPYTKLTVDACKVMAERQVPVVSLTDLSSPISEDGPRRVTLRARSPFYFNSAVSNLFITQVLLATVAQQLGENAINHMSKLEALLQDMSIETE